MIRRIQRQAESFAYRLAFLPSYTELPNSEDYPPGWLQTTEAPSLSEFDHPAIKEFQEFLDAGLVPKDPPVAVAEFLNHLRPNHRVHYNLLRRYIGEPELDSYPYTMTRSPAPILPHEPYAEVTYPKGYELDYDDPEPGAHYAGSRHPFDRVAMADTTMWHPRIEQDHRDGHGGWHEGTYRIKEDGQTIGAMQYSMVPEIEHRPVDRRPPKSIIIDKVFVHPQHRGKGIAQSFVERLHNDFPDYKIDPGATTTDGNGFAEHLRQILPDAEHALISDYTPNVMDDRASDFYDRTQRAYYRAYSGDEDESPWQFPDIVDAEDEAIQHAASVISYAATLVVDPPTLECKHRTPCAPGTCPQRDIAADPDFYAEFPDPADKEREFQDLYRLQNDDAPAPTAPAPPPLVQPARDILAEFVKEHAQPNRRNIQTKCPTCNGLGRKDVGRDPFGQPLTPLCNNCEGIGKVVKTDVNVKLAPWAQRLEDALYGEFMEWWPQSEASRIRKPKGSGTKWEERPEEPVTHWLNVEDFLNERYPEAATGATYGGEEAQGLLERAIHEQPDPKWLEERGYIGYGNPVTQAMLTLHNRFNRRPWRNKEDRRRYYELMLRHVGPGAAKRPKVTASLSADLVNRLQGEFDEWHGGDRIFRQYHDRPGFGIGDWRNVEKFLKDRYPAAHRGFDMGLEEARPLLRGEPNIVAKDFPAWYEAHPRNLADDKPYETGPDAVAQHGYDPKEIAAGMVLLHNRRNTESVFGSPRGTRDDAVAADVDLLNDIFQKRMKMQREYEQRIAFHDDTAWWAAGWDDEDDDDEDDPPHRTAARSHDVPPWQKLLPDEGDGMVTLYHRTHPDHADAIVSGQELRSEDDGEPIWFVTDPDGKPGFTLNGKSFAEAYGSAVVKVRVPREKVWHPGDLRYKPGDVVHAAVYPEHLHGLPIVRHAASNRTESLSSSPDTDSIIYGLSSEFNDWAKANNKGNPYDDQVRALSPKDFNKQYQKKWKPRGPIGYWPNIEDFMKEKYPAAHRGLSMGFEDADPLLDTVPEDLHNLDWLAGKEPYETGPDAVAKHGYDPREIAATLLLLHNDTHPGRENYLKSDQARLLDIARKRMKMQRAYEQRTAGPPPAGTGGYLQKLTDRLRTEFDDWASQSGAQNPYDIPGSPRWWGKERGPIGHWPNVENFLKEKYPASHRGLAMGWEDARPALDAPPLKRYEMGEEYDMGSAPKRYETGPRAVNKYGYDPKEITAAMLLLHSQTHPGRVHGIDSRLDWDRLQDIAQKRWNMQRKNEERRKRTQKAAAFPYTPVKAVKPFSHPLVDKIGKEFEEWATANGAENPNDHPDSLGYWGQPRGAIGYWPNVEDFLEEHYPEAHRGLEMGLEGATSLRDYGRPLSEAIPGLPSTGNYEDILNHRLPEYAEYETGSHAEAQYGYDPKEVVTALLLLHNQTHPQRWDLLNVDRDVLMDIAQKRHKMQKAYEERTKQAAYGDCYTAAFKYLQDKGWPDNLRLVHGEVAGQDIFEGRTLNHAWVEELHPFDPSQDIVIDPSNGWAQQQWSTRIPKRDYYAFKQVEDIGNYHVYTPREAKEKAFKNNVYGPWDIQGRGPNFAPSPKWNEHHADVLRYAEQVLAMPTRNAYIVKINEKLLAPWSVQPAPGTLYRGLALKLTPELREQIASLLGDQADGDETFGQHLKIGPMLLKHIQQTRGGVEQPIPGLGTFWSTDRRVAEDAIAATQSFNQEPGLLPVMMTADWDGNGLDYERMNAGPHNWAGDKEQVLRPGTPLQIKNLHIGVPQAPDGRWYEVLNPGDDDADYRGMGPGPQHHNAAQRTWHQHLAAINRLGAELSDADAAMLYDHMQKLFQPIKPSGKWYHVSPHALTDGTDLIPGGGDSPSQSFYDDGWGEDTGTLTDMGQGRTGHVWLTPDLDDAHFWSAALNAPHIYEVDPHEDPRPWNGTGTDGWVVPGAKIRRKVIA